MKNLRLFSILPVLFLAACSSIHQGKVTHYEAKNNLASIKPADCGSVKSLTREQNPVDILSGVNQCIEQEQYTRAAELYLAAMSYGFYDTKRVADRTAHQAIRVLTMNVFGRHSAEKTSSLRAEVEKLSSNNVEVCQSLIELGSPSYSPGYMIQHGMGAFTGQSSEDGLVEDFNSTEAWEDALGTVAKCEQS